MSVQIVRARTGREKHAPLRTHRIDQLAAAAAIADMTLKKSSLLKGLMVVSQMLGSAFTACTKADFC